MARKPRQLRPEEEALWKKVVEKTAPLELKRPGPGPAQTPKPILRTPAPSIPHFHIGEKAYRPPAGQRFSQDLSGRQAQTAPAMDRKSFGKMKKGRMAPEARIDLHGMTIAQAHPVLTRFILENAAQGRRLVLVITGKGKSKPDQGPIPMRHGVLRHQVPHWLHTPPLNAHVLQVSEAHLKHGGQGAYYVYLHKRR